MVGTPTSGGADGVRRQGNGFGREGCLAPIPLLVAALVLPLPASLPLAAQETRVVGVPGTELQLTLVRLPAGTFRMGSPEGEDGRDPDEGPVHPVELPGFWMTVHEITQDQYAPFRFQAFDGDAGPAGAGSFDVDAVTRPSPPYEDPGHGLGSGPHPTAGMTRWNALHYARWLSEKTGLLFRLPTEAEWEYACRAGGEGPWGSGSDPASLPEGGWLTSNSGGTHHPVGTRAPNPWGLHDLHGNVAEWVLDEYDAGAYAKRADGEAVTEPLAGSPVRGRGVVRGGSFDDEPSAARCAARSPEAAAWKRRDPQIPKSRWWNTDSPHVGFRLVSPDRTYAPQEIAAYFDELLGG